MIQPAVSPKKYCETLLTVSSWITITPSGIDFRTTPCQISKPASVTTNEGTPMSATTDPWKAPISMPATIAAKMQSSPGIWYEPSGTWSCATTTPATPAT